MILPNEARIIELINESKNNGSNTNLCFIGQSGCGKSFTMQQIQSTYENKKNKYNCFYFCGEQQFDDRDYYPFNKFISEFNSTFSMVIKDGIVELAEDSPIAPNLMNHLVKSIIYKKNDDIEKNYGYLNEIEKELVYKLKSIFSDRNGFIIFDNIHFWDRRSLELLFLILKNNTIFDKFTIIIVITKNQENKNQRIIDDIIKIINANTYDFPMIRYEEFSDALTSLGAKKTLTPKQIEVLYPLVNGHIQLMLEIVNEINNDRIDLLFNNSSVHNNLDYMQYLLETRLKELGASGEQILSVLEYASVIGFTFSVIELEKITKNESYELKRIIEDANQLKLINPQNLDEQSFAHEVIWAVFNSRVERNREQYYSDLESCIAEIKPSHYLRRARYCLRSSKFKKAKYLYILEILKQYRIYGQVSSEILREASLILDDADKDYYLSMINASEMVANKKYQNAILQLELIENYYDPVLLAEKYILYSHILTKSFNQEDRSKAVNFLMPYINSNIIDYEKDVKERVEIRLLSSLCHIAQFEVAKEIEDKIYTSLGNRLDYDSEAQYNLNLLRRRSNMLHGCETALVFVNKCIKYFGPNSFGIPKNIRDYYISLGNQSCLQIDNGMFNEGYSTACAAIELEKAYPEITFPRRQIIYNNLIISGYLSNNKTLSECIEEMEMLISTLPNIAEVFTYTSNLSVFYALFGELETAKNILIDEAQKQNISEDIEGYYKFRFLTNLSIYQYLSGDSFAYHLIEDLPKTINSLVNSSYYMRHHMDIIEIMKKGITVETPCEWLKIVHRDRPLFQNQAWNFFGLGYLLAPVSNWDT